MLKEFYALRNKDDSLSYETADTSSAGSQMFPDPDKCAFTGRNGKPNWPLNTHNLAVFTESGNTFTRLGDIQSPEHTATIPGGLWK